MSYFFYQVRRFVCPSVLCRIVIFLSHRVFEKGGNTFVAGSSVFLSRLLFIVILLFFLTTLSLEWGGSGGGRYCVVLVFPLLQSAVRHSTVVKLEKRWVAGIPSLRPIVMPTK